MFSSPLQKQTNKQNQSLTQEAWKLTESILSLLPRDLLLIVHENSLTANMTSKKRTNSTSK